MKCDKLQLYRVRGEMFNGEEICGGFAYYDADEVDEAIAELKARIQLDDDEMAGFLDLEEECGGGDLRNYIAELKEKLDEKDKEIAELKEERRWRKFNEEKPSEEMEGEDFLVSNGYYSVVCEWRGYWNNEPFCGDKNCDVVRYWMTIPSTPKED